MGTKGPRDNIIALSIVVATILLNVIMYPRLPDRIAIHWNIQGVADGYSSRLFGLIIIPFVSLFVYGLFTVLPRIDPNKAFQEFQGFYNGFMNMFLFYVLYFNVIFIAMNMGLQANIGRFITPGIAAMFFSVGVLFEKSKQNWFVGFRTPWTSMGEDVWDSTPQRGGVLFKICGV